MQYPVSPLVSGHGLVNMIELFPCLFEYKGTYKHTLSCFLILLIILWPLRFILRPLGGSWPSWFTFVSTNDFVHMFYDVALCAWNSATLSSPDQHSSVRSLLLFFPSLKFPSLFWECLLSLTAVICKKLPSNTIEGCKVSVYFPPPHLMCPLPPSLSLSSSVVEMGWHGRLVEAAQPPALWWIQTTDTEQTERRRRGGG